MTSLIRVISLGLAAAGFLTVAALTPVHAEGSADLTPDELNQVKTTCLATQNTLRQLRTSDALLRVNRGQLYELMSSKLMTPFNTRLQNNHFDARAFTDSADRYMAALNGFRSDYQAYDQQMAAALNLSCTKNPDKFYDAVVSARTKRVTVHEDILKMNDLIDSYGQLVKYLQSTTRGTN